MSSIARVAGQLLILAPKTNCHRPARRSLSTDTRKGNPLLSSVILSPCVCYAPIWIIASNMSLLSSDLYCFDVVEKNKELSSISRKKLDFSD